MLLHELTHHSRYKKDDVKYGWDACVKLSEEFGRQNADSWSLLGTLAQAMKRSFHLDPKDPASGKLVYDKSLAGAADLKRREEDNMLGRRWSPVLSKLKRVVLPVKEGLGLARKSVVV